MMPRWTSGLQELELADANRRAAARLAQDKIVEVLYLASQYQYELPARLEAMRDACEEIGWTIGNA